MLSGNLNCCKTLLTCITCAATVIHASAQFTFSFDQSIEVLDTDGRKLIHAWAGGLNAAQFNTMDLNGDGKDDLVVYDRMGEKLLTFLNDDNHYRYSPDFEMFFPPGIKKWVLLRDFNCDGKKDIFSGHDFGIQVYKNVSIDGEIRFEQFYFFTGTSKSESLLTLGFSSLINLQLRYDDLPTIEDLDGDGDLDIMNVRFQGEGSVEYHKNFSMERLGTCDSLDFERQSQAWGGFTQCRCENFVFNYEDCSTSGGRIMHGVGKALLALDLNGDNVKDLLYSEAECNSIFALTNKGTIETPLFDEAPYFPTSTPVEIDMFPAAFYEDVDFDGIKDLITAPNVYQRDSYEHNLNSSTWLYKNTGTNNTPYFALSKKAFLQEEMIDVGDNSVPAFYDIDADGDLDLFISYNTNVNNRGSIYLYENTGTPYQPAFRYSTDNYQDFQSLELNNIKIQFADVDRNNKPDLVFLATDPSTNRSSINYLLNFNGFDTAHINTIDLPVIASDNFHLTDVSGDGLHDILLGKSDGSLQYWRNIGSSNNPTFDLQNNRFLGIGPSPLRPQMTCYTGDLNSDGKIDLVYADDNGTLAIVGDYLHVASATEKQADILYNNTLESYLPAKIARFTWPTVANLFGQERPQIVTGSILGGLRILKNENQASNFAELVFSLYPNPVKRSELLRIKSNLAGVLTAYSVTGSELSLSVNIESDTDYNLDVSRLAQGLYVFKFQAGSAYVIRKIVVH